MCTVKWKTNLMKSRDLTFNYKIQGDYKNNNTTRENKIREIKIWKHKITGRVSKS